jgi:short chain dehydrogenase
VDVSSQTSLAALTDQACQRAQAAGVLIDCAGHFPQIASEQMSVEERRRVTDINLTGDFLMIQAFLPLLKATDMAASSTSGPAARYNATRLRNRNLIGPVLVLASAAAFITGQSLTVDGSRHLLCQTQGAIRALRAGWTGKDPFTRRPPIPAAVSGLGTASHRPVHAPTRAVSLPEQA